MASSSIIRVLSVTSECAPLVKTGGLADVAGALPAALIAEGAQMRTLIPGYPAVMAALEDGVEAAAFDDLFGGPARILAGTAAGLDVLVVDAPHLFDRPGSIYLGPDGKDWPDNAERFAALSWVGAWIAANGLDGWQPEVLHGHDWQAGLAPEYLRMMGASDRVASILTIHNIAFHGLTGADGVARLQLEPWRFNADGYEFYGQVSALKAGLMSADWLTTVSETYARELMTPDFGMGLDGVLRLRSDRLRGILNGIDQEAWDPKADPAILTYKSLKGKEKAKAALREEFGLPPADGPLCVVVSRLTEQKGLDLLLAGLPELLARDGQLVLLGSGDKALEGGFLAAANDHDNVAVHIGYDEAMSHRIIAGGDAILVPSRFEPCGLTQMYGLRYGTVPVVALTGGLADTVINASPAGVAAAAATGVQFHPVTQTSFDAAIQQLCDLYAQPKLWAKMQRNGQKHPVGWAQSAAAYVSLYQEAMAA